MAELLLDPMNSERYGLFLDINNLYFTTKRKFNRKINYKKLTDSIINQYGNPFRQYAYTSENGDGFNDFVKYLAQLGYTVYHKKPKEYFNKEYDIDLSNISRLINKFGESKDKEYVKLLERLVREKRERMKADWDVGLSIDAMKLEKRIDTFILGSADGDYSPLIRYFRNIGIKCIVYGCSISKELQESCDRFYELTEQILS